MGIYIMGMLLKYNSLGVNATKTKHGINIRQSSDNMLSEKNIFCGTK